MNQPKNIVFCDFDGTITAVETFAGMLKEFTPELSAELMPQMYNLSLTLREGVKRLLESIPSKRYPEIIEYAANKAIRPGLGELIDFLDSYEVPFVVISGGLRGMVETVLKREGLLDRMGGIAAVDLDTTGEFLKVNSQFEEGTELVGKVQVMAKYPAAQTIAIGDSVTDINMALKADVVFARDRLKDYLAKENKPYIPWNDFLAVRDYLAQQWN